MKWSMRDNNNYEETGLLVSLSYFADNRRQFLENFYQKSKRSILKAHNEGPAAYVMSAGTTHDPARKPRCYKCSSASMSRSREPPPRSP